jgi:integrase
MSLKLQIRSDRQNNYWQIVGSQFGKRVRRCTGTSDRAQAEIILAKLQGQAFEHHAFGPQATVTFIEAARSYLGAGKGGKNPRFLQRLLYKDKAKTILTNLATTPLRDIDQRRLDDLRDELCEPDAKNSTIVRNIYMPITAVMRHAAKRKLCAVPLFDVPKQPKGRTRWLKLEEAERLIAECSPHFAPYVIFLLGTGCRLSEALYINWSEIDLEGGHATIIGPTDDDDDEIRTKNGNARVIPLVRPVIAALRALPDREGPVFRRPDGKPYARLDEAGKGGRHVHTALAGAAERAGLKHVHPHLMRHTFATWHVMMGTHQFELMRLGGWLSIEMVKRYSHVEGIKLSPAQRAALAQWTDPAAPAPAAKLRVAS